MLGGEILLIPGGFPLIVDNVNVGTVGCGPSRDGDLRTVKAGMAPWETYRQSRR
jgi:hypothetical protein